IESLSDWTVNDGTLLAEAYELLVDEATVFERRPSPEAYSAFKKATANARVASVVPSLARSRGDASQKLIEQIAGDCPDAWLVVIAGAVEHRSRRYKLSEESIIGRTAEADICVVGPGVSRRHAEVFADAGEYWISDLGSTSPTFVNGTELGRAPHKLETGDVI